MRNRVSCLAALVLFIGLAACATSPAKIDGKRYNVKKCGCSIEIPPSWKIANRIPFFIENDIKAIIDPAGCLILTNQGENAVILSFVTGHSLRWSELDFSVQTIEKIELEDAFDKMINDKLRSGYRSLSIMPNGRRVTHENWKAGKDDFEIRPAGSFVVQTRPDSGMTDSLFWIYLFPCRGGKVCSLWLMLMSNQTDFSDNMRAFRTLQSSIRAYDKGSF